MNSIILIGRLTKEPEVKVSSNEKKFATFTIAVNKRMKRDEANFIPCIAFGAKAELIEKYVGKGSKIAISGELESRKYDKDGETRTAFTVIVEEIDLIGKKKEEPEVRNDLGGISETPITPPKAPSLEHGIEDYGLYESGLLADEGTLPFEIN